MMVNNKFIKILRWVIFTFCIVLIMHFVKTNVNDFKIIYEFDAITIIYLFVIQVVYLALVSFRMLIIMRRNKLSTIRFGDWFKICVIGRFINKFVPQAGHIYRGVLLKRNYEFPYSSYIRSLVVFSWLEICLNFLLALILIAIINPNLTVGIYTALPIIGACFIFITMCPFLAGFIIKNITLSGGRISKIAEKVLNLVNSIIQNLKDFNLIFKVISVSIILFFLGILQIYVCFLRIGVNVELSNLALFQTILKISQIILITPGGNVGVEELTFGVLSKTLGIGMAEGIIIIVILRIINYTTLFIFSIIYGFPFLQKKHVRTSVDQS